mmetsp:Transcript_15204/g.16911  ORF Transcript_15204/g.16911 Transcript_15204/m.16911 type:complete len:99 (+) Transcript_15204:576-872(+)
MQGVDVSVDFSKISSGSMKRYQAFFRIASEPTADPTVESIKTHFEKEFNPDPNQIIEKFLKIKKDDKQEEHQPIRKSARNKEKQERKNFKRFAQENGH